MPEPAWMRRLGEIADDLWQRGDRALSSDLHALRRQIVAETSPRSSLGSIQTEAVNRYLDLVEKNTTNPKVLGVVADERARLMRDSDD